MSKRVYLLSVALWAVFGLSSLFAGPVIITEIKASNRDTLADEDGEFTDWIEFFNTDVQPVSLAGWYLTDDRAMPQKWTFPDVEIPGGGFMIVFASGKDRAVPGSELHLNFRLEKNGDYLALVTPEGTIDFAFDPKYPRQVAHASYGFRTQVSARRLIADGATAKYVVPSGDALGRTWVEPDFIDDIWSEGFTGIGFDTKEPPTLTDLIRTNVEEIMHTINASIYVRLAFDFEPGDPRELLQLRVKYDDGFIAYLNGVEVVRRNARSTTPRYNWTALRETTDFLALQYETIPLPPDALSLLKPGRNVLAFQAFNRRRSGDDFVILPEMDAILVESVDMTEAVYFEEPSPVWPNSTGKPAVAPEPAFSQPTGAYQSSVAIELTAEIEGAEIRFTTDNSEPDLESELYAGPVTLESATVLKARTYHPQLVSSSTVANSYVILADDAVPFESNIPLVVCNTFGRRIGSNCGGGPYTNGHIMIFTPDDQGSTKLTHEAHFSDIAGFRKRGSSTCGRPKFSFNVEVRDENGDDKNAKVFDWVEESDFILYGPYNFDRGLMRNPIAYWMSREVGPWAARTRFVEVFLNETSGPVRRAHYFGVYAFMEKNKRNAERIDVERMDPSITTPPHIEGGYILKRDRVGAGEVATSAGGYSSLVFVYPKQPTSAQRAWITAHINQAIGSINPSIGSQEDSNLIDVQEFLDHHILNWYPKNVDAFRLSGYMHKRRDGLFAMGPVWDYDRTMGCSDDSRAASPTGWDNNSSGDGGTRYFQAGGLGSWYSKLFNNVPPTGESNWAKAYRSRWRQLRAGPLRTQNITDKIDEWGMELSEAAVRNFQRWPGVGPRFGGFQGEVNHLKNWLSTRAAWIDSQFIESPEFSVASGEVEPGTQVEIFGEDGDIVYTINGPDPKAPNGDTAPEAVVYTGPITVNENTRIRARIRIGGTVWSQLVQGVYVTQLLPLVVTEINYNPPTEGEFSSADFEFIEFQNAGTEPIPLKGVRLMRTTTATPRFEFPDRMLAPGEFVVIVQDPAAFESRYGASDAVLGRFSQTLSNTRQTIRVVGPIDEVLQQFTYDDDWYPSTDGGGDTLVAVDPSKADTAEGWRASLFRFGSPGREDAPLGDGFQIPGDLSQDGTLNMADALRILMFLVGGSPLPCQIDDANTSLADVNGDEALNFPDAIYLLNHLFAGGPGPMMGNECTGFAGCPDNCVTDL